MGKGQPVDVRDSICKAHKECLHCTSKQYGANRDDSCLSDNVSYMYMYDTLKAEVYCTNDADTCERATCECDVAFAKALLAVKHVYDEKYHHYYGNFDATENCLSGSGPAGPGSAGPGSADKKCCNNADKSTSFKLYNSNNQKCCSDGSIKHFGEFC